MSRGRDQGEKGTFPYICTLPKSNHIDTQQITTQVRLK